MSDCDELLARADWRVRGGTGFVEYDHGRDTKLIRELRNALRATLATRPQPLPDANEVYDWLMTHGVGWVASVPAIKAVLRAVEAMATCTCLDVETGRGFEDCPVHDPDLASAGSAIPDGDNDG
jgi:hypothetical protein